MQRLTMLSIDPKKAGLIIIGISVILFLVVLFMTQTILELRLELHKSCPLPPESCPYKGSVPIESVTAFILVIATGIFGSFLTLTTRQSERVMSKEKVKINKIVKEFSDEERRVYDAIAESEGSIFQSDLVSNTGYSKVKVSRILDKLETKDIVERRRRGMSNIIVLKHI